MAQKTVEELLKMAKQLEASVERQRKDNEDMTLAMAEILGRTPKKGKVRQRATEQLEQLQTPEELYARQIMAEEQAPREQTGAANSGGAADAAFNGALLDPRTDDILYSLAELRNQNQEQRYSTDIMVRDQQGILDKLKKMDQNNYLKALELKKNQNPVLDVNPYIQHNDDIATAQRRAAEEIKYQQDYFTRAEQMSQIMTEQQYLTQQIYANEHWGIPSLQGITYGDGEYFTSR